MLTKPRISFKCKCPEAHIDGFPVPRVHNCGYIKFRNQFLDRAEKKAQSTLNKETIRLKLHELPKVKRGEQEAKIFNSVFFSEMDKRFEAARPY
jgi:hypothetical protein